MGEIYEENCRKCSEEFRELKEKLIAEFNALGIKGMKEVTDLNELKGSFINMEYTLPSGQNMKIWDDDKIYLGNELCIEGSDRCYGIAGDEKYLMVCEYGDAGADPELVVFKRWN